MKVHYKKLVYEHGAFYKLLSYGPKCCDDMRNQIDSDDENVVFGENDAENFKAELCLNMRHREYYGQIEHDYVPINYCPWCSSPVETVQDCEVRMVKKTEEKTETTTRTFYVEES